MKLSFVYLTYRPGGIDLLAQGLASQTVKGGWDIVVVDDFPGRPERRAAANYLRSAGIDLSWYGPSKPKSYPDTHDGLANAMNTGAMHARGDAVVFVHDYSVVAPTAAESWIAFFSENPRVVAHGVGIELEAPRPEAPTDTRTWTHLTFPTFKRLWIPRPETMELFYLGVPARLLEESNGFDERADHLAPKILDSLLAHVATLGYETVVCHNMPLTMADHREWDGPGDHMIDTQWRKWGLVSHVDPDTLKEWPCPSPNPFDFAEERRRCLAAVST